MPEHRDMIVKVTQLHKGDYMILWDSSVVGVSQKRLYTYVTDSNGAEHRFDSNEEVTVSRSFPTEEEQKQRQHSYAERYITNHIAIAGEAKERTKAELLSRLDYKDVSYHGSSWESYAMAQAEFEIWNVVSAVATNREIDVVEAAILVRDEQLKKLINNSRFLHGSTNGMSNMSEAILSEVRRRFIVDLEWILL